MPYIKQVLSTEKSKRSTSNFVRTPFHMYSVLHRLCVLSGDNIAFLWEEGGTRSVTEGVHVTLVFHKFYRNALSLTRLCREGRLSNKCTLKNASKEENHPKHCF